MMTLILDVKSGNAGAVIQFDESTDGNWATKASVGIDNDGDGGVDVGDHLAGQAEVFDGSECEIRQAKARRSHDCSGHILNA